MLIECFHCIQLAISRFNNMLLLPAGRRHLIENHRGFMLRHVPLANTIMSTDLNLICACRGFPVEHFKGDRLGLVLAFWGLGLVLGKPLVSQTDYTEDGKTFGGLNTGTCPTIDCR